MEDQLVDFKLKFNAEFTEAECIEEDQGVKIVLSDIKMV
jgi:hypothetical protein